MDALTNVVAVLILVLVLVQADVVQKVQKFIDDLQPATSEVVARSRRTVEDLALKQRLAEARLLEKPASPAEIEEQERQLILLEKSLKETKLALADANEMRALETKVRTERDAEHAKTGAILKEIAHIEALLETIKLPPPDAPTVVNIPNSRPVPEGARVFHAIVHGERVHIIDPNTPITIIKRELEKKKNEWLVERVKIKGKPDRLVYDGTKIAAHFQNFNWGNTRGQTIQVLAEPTKFFLWLAIRPNLTTSGTKLDELGNPGSEFAKALPVIRSSFKPVLLYRVHTNAFPTYLAARELSEKAGIPAGWEINFGQEFRIPIPDLTVKRLKEPPPPKPGATPAKPKPKTQLD